MSEACFQVLVLDDLGLDALEEWLIEEFDYLTWGPNKMKLALKRKDKTENVRQKKDSQVSFTASFKSIQRIETERKLSFSTSLT